MQTIKVREIVAVDLNTGDKKHIAVDVPCSLAHYIRAIHILNKSAHVCGIVYMPSELDEEYLEYIK